MKAILVTACPAGIATSFLVAKRIEQQAKLAGWELTLDVGSSVQPRQIPSKEQIAAADLILVVASAPVDLAAYDGKRLYQGIMDLALQDPAAVLDAAASGASVYHHQAAPVAAAQPASAKRIVAVTACPTGVAHTFMSAEALETMAKQLGYQIRVETQGSVGAQNALTADEIAAADLVFLATDIEVDMTRFDGKQVYRTSTGAALKKTRAELDKAWLEAKVYRHSGASQPKKEEKAGPYKHLLTGVSFMLPMVVAGGLIIAISFIFGIEAFKVEGSLAAALMTIGGASAFALMIPVLAGYIAYSIADRPGLAPGMIGGMLASSLGAGFLGGIVAGFLAGYSAKYLSDKVRLPVTLEALKPILIIPLFASLFTGLVIIYVVGGPVAGIMSAMTEFLNNMGSANAVLLGVIIGAMMCFDMGGPVNKAAYAFGVGLLASKTYAPMAAVMAAGMVPALGMGIATFLARAKFIKTEQEAGKASFVLGLCFISEGAIPFAAKDPMRVIPACMAGGALTGALSMLFGCELVAPHGGLFVLFIPNAISHVFMYILAIAAGSLVTGVGYAMLKRGEEQAKLATT
ncbi:PTS fructose transporter subunit IIBC [Aeromonas salmonicida subsp. salmonicida]|uniref:protein-N(pi)-phosphohistidine--D-fructose phosphotransferase n=2 Tax=Aeromonas salmonicida subsp. salmonicida TaxID=29491 RepID=A4SM92_AERS4|nr:PTS fructose transporter subunit IIBC [Aeromonas salmonicida]ABO90014.1 Phosphotransferase system, fructose-specific IIC component [Aeromonas salmonicida subsp. salmonicida A449]AYO63073.1 PTS fructose transporter subunit IIBC [Aeromonas salmonicida subsp. salmonicida 01-B526]EHI52239.1 phosphotransferase system, fructose-specific IIC component [Aeromonas salmonicida subsp. salmonicida 01-B526]EKP0239790.1 PTS fructose transporter subunit IIBC [Aeromonas salmonicida]EKP0244039.1 PTS fructos